MQLYRCYILWDRRWLVLALPSLFWGIDFVGIIASTVYASIHKKDYGGSVTSPDIVILIVIVTISSFLCNLTLTCMSYHLFTIFLALIAL